MWHLLNNIAAFLYHKTTILIKNHATQKKTKQVNKKEKFVWRYNRAKYIILDDLERGVLPLYEREQSTETAWEAYKDKTEFKEVTFNKFKDRLKDHRKQVIKQRDRSSVELVAFCHDCQLYPRAEVDGDGNVIFDLSDAKKLLQKDIADGKHKNLSHEELQNSHNEYKSYPAKKLKERIYQEV